MAATCPDRCRPQHGDDGGDDREREARCVRAEILRHAPHGLRDDGDRHHLETVQPAGIQVVRKSADAVSKDEERDGRGRRESKPGCERPGQPRGGEADSHADLAARGARCELAERDEIRVRPVVQPLPPRDEFLAEIAQVRDRPAEGGEPELEKDLEYRESRHAPGCPGSQHRFGLRHDFSRLQPHQAPMIPQCAAFERNGLAPCECDRGNWARSFPTLVRTPGIRAACARRTAATTITASSPRRRGMEPSTSWRRNGRRP